MRKKKIVVLLISAAFAAIAAVGCAKEKADPEAVLLGKGMELIGSMDQMAESPEYRRAYTEKTELNQRVEAMGKQDYGKPAAVYSLTIPEESRLEVMSQFIDTDCPEEIKKILARKLFSAVPMQICASGGTLAVASSATVNATTSFLCPGLIEDTLYLYLYDSDYSAMVVFLPEEDGVVSAASYFLETGVLREDGSPEAVSDWLTKSGLFGMKGITVNQVSLPENFGTEKDGQ